MQQNKEINRLGSGGTFQGKLIEGVGNFSLITTSSDKNTLDSQEPRSSCNASCRVDVLLSTTPLRKSPNVHRRVCERVGIYVAASFTNPLNERHTTRNTGDGGLAFRSRK